MANRYRVLIDLKLEHAFYSDRRIPGLRIVALPATALRMRNHRLLLKPYADGIRILQECRDVEGETVPLVKPDAPLDLAFGFQCNDPLLQVRTAVEFFSSNKKKLVFDLRGAANATSLQPELLPLAIGGYAYTPAAPEAAVYRVTDGDGKTVYEKRADASDVQVMFPLYEENENKYVIKSGDADVASFLLLHRDSAFDGVVLMRSSDAEQQFTARFPARSIYWEYTVVPKYNNCTEPGMTEESDRISFESVVHPEVSGAWLFTSREPVELQERYPYVLQIEDQGRTVRKQIPFGDLRNTGTCLINVDNFCLKNYVMV